MTCTLCGENCWPPCWRSWSGQLGRMQKTPVILASSTGLFLDWPGQPSDVYLDNPHLALRQLHAYCSGSARGEAPSPRLNEKGGD